MEYRKLGNSGLPVSALSLGSWLTFGKQIEDKTAEQLMALAFDRGVNFFDNAECLRLSVEFINDRATEVSVHCNGAGFDIPSDQNEFSDNFYID